MATQSAPGDSAQASVQELVARLLNEVRSGWRYRWFGAALAWTAFLLGWGWVALQPNIYEATARVYVDTSSVLRPILEKQIVPLDVETQLGYVRQSLLGRAHLERVVVSNGLDAKATTPAEVEQVLNTVRESIDIASRDRTDTVYTISYRHSDRGKAIGVVTTLLNSLVEDTIGENQQGSDEAGEFLDARIVEYEQRLQQAEKALADFKKLNSNRLPGAQGDYFQRLHLANESLDGAEKALRLAVSRRDQIRAQLNSESPVMPSDSAATEPAPNSIDGRIRTYQSELDSLLLQYTEKHPDVISVRETLTRLQDQRTAQLRVLGVSDPDQELSGLGSNPVYQALRIALNEAEVEISARQDDVNEFRAEADALQALIDEVPDVEAQLARLNRDYDVIYEQYQEMVRSRETQNLSQKALSADQVEFRVIDPPLADFRPVAPNRLVLLAGAFAASLGLGGALCWLMAQLNPVFTSMTSLRDVCGIPVLGAISLAAPLRLRARRSAALLAFAGAMGGLAVLFGTAVLIESKGPGIVSLIGLA